MYFLRKRYPHVVFTLENPVDTLACYPLMAILEAPGVVRLSMAYVWQ